MISIPLYCRWTLTEELRYFLGLNGGYLNLRTKEFEFAKPISNFAIEYFADPVARGRELLDRVSHRTVYDLQTLLEAFK